MDPLKIITKYYQPDTKVYQLLIKHSKVVTEKALELAGHVPQLHPDLNFIAEAAMLHDLGIFLTNSPGIDCHGKESYIRHGYLGAEILRKEGYPKHALVCERHLGAGLSVADIESENLLLPQKDMVPVSTEEEIICLADKFFSKDKTGLYTISEILDHHAQFGDDKISRLKSWIEKYRA